MSIPKVRICVPFPNNGSIHTACERSLRALQKADFLDCDNSIFKVKGASISVLRSNGVIGEVSNKVYHKDFDFDYYMCVDSDIAFHPKDVKALIDKDKDIISGAYQSRANPNLAVAGKFKEIKGLIGLEDFLPWERTGLHKVDWAGAGFLLVKRNVFEKLKFPYFREQVIEWEEDGELKSSWVGEDVGFCMAAKEAGFDIYCDMGVKVKHLTTEISDEVSGFVCTGTFGEWFKEHPYKEGDCIYDRKTKQFFRWAGALPNESPEIAPDKWTVIGKHGEHEFKWDVQGDKCIVYWET